jgi:polar amino acid transport system substrate-binding protein
VKSRRGAAVAAALVMLGVAACSSPSDRALSHSIAPLGASPPTTAPATTSTTTPPPCVPTASLAPTTPSVPAPEDFPAGSSMATIRAKNQLVVGVDEGTQNWGYRDPKTGQIDGLDVALLEAVAEAIFRDGNPRAHLEFKTLTTAERITAVADGKVDMVASLLTATCGRWQQVDFSTEYYEAHQALLVPLDSTIKTLDDLAGKTVCATRGSTSIGNIQSLVPTAKVYPVDARSQCLIALEDGTVDAITSDDTILASFQAQENHTKRPVTTLITDPRFEAEPYAIAIKKHREDLVRFVNAVLAQMRNSGELQQLYDQWLGKNAPLAPPAPVYQP